MNNIALIGVGPHAKRIYLKYLKEHKKNLSIIVEIENRLEATKQFLDEEEFKDYIIYTIPKIEGNDEHLPKQYENELKKLFHQRKITHMIISTEPKAHNMYLEFALKNNINVLSDKPITVLKDMKTKESIDKMRKQYYNLLDMYDDKKCVCKVMCQRLCHRGYKYVKDLLRDVITKYNIPITYIDIYHCDGNWEMPHDLGKENHPYKYGYGKLYHSGFHFIDLLSQLLELNNLVSDNKLIKTGKMYANEFTPNDEKEVFTKDDYFNIFEESQNSELYRNLEKINFDNYGEKNFYGQFSFYNKNNALITTANLNLLHYGFSRRGWFESRDYYKKNGRVRHERVTINVGPLMCIHITSYQSKEIKDRNNCYDEIMEGGLEHFDIDIYRNVDIIGGKPHEKIKLFDLYKDSIDCDRFIGYNEMSREEFLNNFFNNYDSTGDIRNEKQAVELLYSCSTALIEKNKETEIKMIDNNEKLTLIKKITDKDFDIKEKRLIDPKRRTAARGIIENKDGKIAIFFKSKMNEYKLPGGGIDLGEDKEKAFKREALEETGCIIKNIKEMGITIEEESQTNFIQKSYVFKSKVQKNTNKLDITEREKEEGAELIWLHPKEALDRMKNSIDRIRESRFENKYNSSFIIKRDIAILEYYLNESLNEV